MTIRPLRAADLERATQIAAALPTAPRWPLGAYQEALDPSTTPRRICLAMEDAPSAPIAGFLIARIVADEAELETIAVDPARQRQGLGHQLLTELIVRLHQDSVTELQLELRPSNTSALALYRRAGFLDSGRRRAYYTDPVEDALLLQLFLRP